MFFFKLQGNINAFNRSTTLIFTIKINIWPNRLAYVDLNEPSCKGVTINYSQA